MCIFCSRPSASSCCSTRAKLEFKEQEAGRCALQTCNSSHPAEGCGSYTGTVCCACCAVFSTASTVCESYRFSWLGSVAATRYTMLFHRFVARLAMHILTAQPRPPLTAAQQQQHFCQIAGYLTGAGHDHQSMCGDMRMRSFQCILSQCGAAVAVIDVTVSDQQLWQQRLEIRAQREAGSHTRHKPQTWQEIQQLMKR